MNYSETISFVPSQSERLFEETRVIIDGLEGGFGVTITRRRNENVSFFFKF